MTTHCDRCGEPGSKVLWLSAYAFWTGNRSDSLDVDLCARCFKALKAFCKSKEAKE